MCQLTKHIATDRTSSFKPLLARGFFNIYGDNFTPAEEEAGVELLTGHQAPLLTVRSFLKFIPYSADYAEVLT